MGSLTPVAPGTPMPGLTDGIGQNLSDFGNWLTGRGTAPAMGPNPYQSSWDALIAQLRQTASGTGPSLAGNAFNEASDKAMNQQVAMTRGGSAGAARQGAMNMGQIGQGMAQGYANARLQEQMAAQAQLAQALQGAGQAWFNPANANLNAQLQSPTNLQMITGTLGQLGAGLGSLGRGKPPQQGPQGGMGGGYIDPSDGTWYPGQWGE